MIPTSVLHGIFVASHTSSTYLLAAMQWLWEIVLKAPFMIRTMNVMRRNKA